MKLINDISRYLVIAQKQMIAHAPEILTGVGISGFVSATIMAVKATPKALDKIEAAEYAKNEELDFPEKFQHLTKVEVIKTVGVDYIPPIVLTGLSIGCVVGSTIINNKRCASLATAYMLSEAARLEYKDKVIDMLGEKKERKVEDAINSDKLRDNPIKSNEEIIATNKGTTLCYDSINGRYFYSDAETIRQVVLNLNYRLMSEMFISVNEFCDDLGLPHVQLGDDLGWHVDQGLIEVDFTSDIAANGEPCLVISYSESPKWDFRDRY